MSDNTFRSKEFKENLIRYEEARKAGSSIYLEPEDFTDIAQYYHLHGRLSEALQAIDDALQIFPGATEPLAFRARVAILIEHDAVEAMRYANMIEDKHDFDYYYIVAEIMIADNRVEDAEAYLEKKESEVDADDKDDFCLDVAMLYADYDVFDLSEEWLNKCDETDEDDYLEIKGRIALSRGKLKDSRAVFDKLIDRDPYSTTYWNLLASTQYLNNDISGCIESSDFALAIDPDDTDALLNKANSLTMLGNTGDALECYKHYKRLQPQSEVADMGIAAVMMAENNLDDALEHWQKAAKLCGPYSSNKMDIYRNMTLVYASMGKYDEAFETIDRLASLTPDYVTDIDVLRGYIALLSEDAEKAYGYFKRAHTSASKEESDNVLYYIAFCYFDCGYMKQAHELLRHLADSKDNKRFTDLWAYLVRTDYELGLQDEFLADLKKATERNPHGLQRELSDVFPNGMAVRDFYNYAVHHPIKKR